MYSQAYQDEFVDLALNKQDRGFFVDVGAGCDDPTDGSNSLMFEQRGWNGVAVDADINRMRNRNCKTVSCLIGDGTNNTVELGKILRELTNTPDTVDYLSVDIEGQDFFAVKSFHDCGYRFKVATIEHNLYSRNPGVDRMKNDIFHFLTNHGYVRVVDNAGHKATLKNLHNGWAFEDWYVDPKHIDLGRLMIDIALGTQR